MTDKYIIVQDDDEYIVTDYIFIKHLSLEAAEEEKQRLSKKYNKKFKLLRVKSRLINTSKPIIEELLSRLSKYEDVSEFKELSTKLKKQAERDATKLRLKIENKLAIKEEPRAE